MRQGEARFDRAAGGAFEAADAAGHVHLLVHLHPHRTAAAAEIALDTFLGIEAKMEQAEPVEQREETAQRTKNAAPWTMNEQGGGEEGQKQSGLEPAHHPAFAGQDTLDRVRHAGLQRARRAKPADGDGLVFVRNALETENHRQQQHQSHQRKGALSRL